MTLSKTWDVLRPGIESRSGTNISRCGCEAGSCGKNRDGDFGTPDRCVPADGRTLPGRVTNDTEPHLRGILSFVTGVTCFLYTKSAYSFQIYRAVVGFMGERTMCNANYRGLYLASAAISLLLAWAYCGFYPLGMQYEYFPPQEGTLLNDVMRYIALPLTLLVMIGGALAAGNALAIDSTASENERKVFAFCAAPGMLWILGAGLGFESAAQGSPINSIAILALMAFLSAVILLRVKRLGII